MFHATHGEDGGETGVDDDFVARDFDGIGDAASWMLASFSTFVRSQ